ncbi:leucyl aminopeptidase [Brachyspira alvinipulli]|uniref:leucyl aminopeptidase family protein n=1 Tax=Brachyspira alvinipulli TaxID=84379 RepID=UPI003003CBC2
MKLKHTINFIKKHTVAIFVKVEKEEPKVCTFNEEYIKLFNSLVKDKYYTTSTPFAFAFASNTRVIFITYKEVKNYMYETWKNAGASLIKIMKDLHIDDIEVDMAELFSEIASEESYIQFCLGIILSSYRFDNYLGDKRLKEQAVIKNILLVSEHKKDTENAILKASQIADCIFWARDMINEPSNVINSLTFTDRAKKQAESRKITTTVLTEKELKAANMNGILGVNAGSKNPPRVFIAQYKKAKAKRSILLVGKGITFDTGGMSLKPADSMYGMKDDMSGAAAVCGALFLISDMGLDANVTVICPLTDNKTGSGAINPGDVLKMHNGVTVEVVNTDAEGRLILADALAYGIKKYNPDYVIDIATLTGACSIALGKHATGLMSNDEFLSNAIKEAGNDTYERVWELPMFDEYKEQIKSDIADIKNTGGREAGTITAAQFLSYFTEGSKWAHLDIACTSYSNTDNKYIAKGGTGVGVYLLAKTVEKLVDIEKF